MKKVLTTSAVMLMGVTLGACSTGTVDEPTPMAAEPDTSATTGDTSPEPSLNPTIGNLDDPLCAGAKEALESANAIIAKSQELGEMMFAGDFFESEDATELNAWGVAVLDLSGESVAFYELGVEQTQGEPINEDFAMMSMFVQTYTNELARSAADAESPSAFLMDIQEQMTSEEAKAATEASPEAAANLTAYLTERCDITA